MLDGNIMADIEKMEVEIKSTQETQSKVAESLNKGFAGIGVELDFDNAKLEDVQRQQEAMSNNIASLISNLDSVTNELGSQFNDMKEKSTWESFVSVFSRDKAQELRSDRISKSSIDAKLQDLVTQSDRITNILQVQHGVLTEQYNKIQNSLVTVTEKRKLKVTELEDIREKMKAMDPQIIEMENKITAETNAKARTDLNSELQKLNTEFNELVNKEQVVLAESQSLEKYEKAYESFQDSLLNQKSTQEVLINKLTTDSKERQIIYTATVNSLKTASQQDVAHKINDIGNKVDTEVTKTVAHIGAAANNRMVEMLESHEGHMADMNEIQESKRKADDRFWRRFGDVLDKHESAKYSKPTE